MTEKTFFGDSMVLSVEDPDSGSVPVAGLQSVSITLSHEYVELYTADSTEREAVKRREQRVPVDIEYAKFDETLAQWVMGVTSAGTSVSDTSDVALFNIEGEIESTDGNLTLEVTVEDAYVDGDMPIWEASEGEFIAQNISMVGKTISNLDQPGA